MKIPLGSAFPGLPTGRDMIGEVVARDKQGSLMLLNGVPVRTSASLAVGQKFAGTIVRQENQKAALVMTETAVGNSPKAILASWSAPVTDANVALLEMMQKFGLSFSRETFEQATALLQANASSLSENIMEAIGLLMSHQLPDSALKILEKYVKGSLNFAKQWESLGNDQLQTAKHALSKSNLFNTLLKLIESTHSKSFQRISKNFPDNLLLQEMLSTTPKDEQEGHLYFQWPIFWADQALPDTIEGEAFYSQNTDEKSGFSLRIAATPPNLGPMEIGLHRLSKKIWCHFATSGEESQKIIREIFPPLKKALLARDWHEVQCTAGAILPRKTFLSPQNCEHTTKQARVKIDVKA